MQDPVNIELRGRIIAYTIYMKSSIKKVKIAAGVVGLVLLLALTVTLYIKDSETVQEAMRVRAYVVNFCMENTRYPKKEEFEKRFPRLAADPDWSYSPGEELQTGTFQYPLNLPVPSAPGYSKFSVHIPVVDTYAVTNPCQVFSRELL